MSNRLTVQYTIFVDLDLEGNEIHRYYGYRIYDDYQAEYNNGFESFEEVAKKVNPENIQEFLEDNYPGFYEGAEFKGGMFLGDDWITLTKEN